MEQALESVADAQLFEVNDEITRANFVNAVEPYLRDVQAKRGLFDFVVKCDENNNTPDIIDNNEFRADIFLKLQPNLSTTSHLPSLPPDLVLNLKKLLVLFDLIIY